MAHLFTQTLEEMCAEMRQEERKEELEAENELEQAHHKIESLERQLEQLQDDYWKLEHAIEECVGGECHHALEE